MVANVVRAGLALVITLIGSAPAAAQSLDLAMSCASETGGLLTTGTTITWGNAGRARCSVDYNNDSGARLPEVWLRVGWDPLVETNLAPALPDGVEGLGSTQTWRPAGFIIAVPGSPNPSFHEQNQTADFRLGDVENLTAAEFFFDWLPPSALAVATYSMHVQAFVGGPPGSGTADARLDFSMVWNPGNEWIEVRPIPQVQVARRYVGSAIIGAQAFPASAHKDAVLMVYLPYRDAGTGTIVADGNYNAASDTRVVNETDLGVQLLMRNRSERPELEYVMPPGTALDGNGDLSWPLSGPNAHKLIIYDPQTHSITANIGVLWAAEVLTNAGYGSWRLRWDAAFRNTGLLPAGTTVPVQTCFKSASTGTVAPGNARWCHTANSVIGPEVVTLAVNNVGCPGFTNHNTPCRGENLPFFPGDDGASLLKFTNSSSLEGDTEIVMQLPGMGGTRHATLTGVKVGPGAYVPTTPPGLVGATVEIWVSTSASDYSDPNVAARVVGGAATWQQCSVTGGSEAPAACDIASLPVPVADIEEVRIVIRGTPSQYLSLEDDSRTIRSAWVVEVGWVLQESVAGSINASPYSSTSSAGAAFAMKARARLVQGAIIEAASATETGEVTRQSFVTPCGVSPGPFAGGANAMAMSCNPGQLSSTSLPVMSQVRMQWGVANTGVINNVRGPFHLCLPIPIGFKFENTADPQDPRFPRLLDAAPFGSTTGGSATFLDASLYSYTFTPVTDPEFAGTYCVDVPTHTLAGGRSLQVVLDGRLVPGVRARAHFGDPARPDAQTYECSGEDAAGAPVTHAGNLSRSWADLSGAAKFSVTSMVAPSTVIGSSTAVCYDYTLDTHAFLDDGTLAANGATLPTENAVSYQWIPRSDGMAPASASRPSTGSTQFVSASSLDVRAIWVHTAEDPARGDATTLAGNGWVLCASAGDLCDAAALEGMTLTPADVRWVAFEFGRLEVSDAEPRGVAPLDGRARVNVPYAATVCVAENGSADASEIVTVLESTSSNLLTVVTEPAPITVATGCPAGGFGMPESCNGADDDCDGEIDDGVCVPDAGMLDAAVAVDAAMPVDASMPDAAVEVDAAMPHDASMPDAAAELDASVVTDASAPVDAAMMEVDASVALDAGARHDAADAALPSASGDAAVGQHPGDAGTDDDGLRARPCACDSTGRSQGVPLETLLLAVGVMLFRRRMR